MPRFSSGSLAVASIAFICTADLGLAAQKIRALRQNDQPIVSRLLPDDQVVTIERVVGPGLPPPAGWTRTRESELRDLGRWEEVAVIDAPKSHTSFVMNGTWLTTRVTARVSQILKTGRLGTTPGGPIEFQHEGGELEVNGVIVRSASGVFFESSRTYLVAVRFHPDLQAWQVVVMYDLDNEGRLQGSKRRDGSTPSSELHGMRLADVAASVSKGAQ